MSKEAKKSTTPEKTDYRLIFKALGFQVIFFLIILFSFSLYFPLFIQDAVVLKDTLEEFQSQIPHIDPYETEELPLLEQSLLDYEDLRDARNNLLKNSSILFVFLVLVSSLLFAKQRTLFDPKESFKKSFIILLLTQIGLFFSTLLFLLIASILFARLGIIDNEIVFYSLIIITGILYSYVYIVFFRRKHLKRTLIIHTIFMLIGLVYLYVISQFIEIGAESILFTALFFLPFLLFGLFISTYEKYLLFQK